MKGERMKIDLITNVSHDLKTPLTSIIGYVDLLSRDDTLSDEAKDYVTILVKKTERLKDIISDLFELAKSTSGDIKVDMEEMDMKRLVEQTLGDMADQIEESGFGIRYQCNTEHTKFMGDGNRMYRVVQNVIENALKYSPNAILVVISNPMDTMTYLALKSLGLPKNRVIGMGGALDSSRFKYFLSQALGCNANEVEGMVIGGHGDTTMIPLTRFATYKGMPVSNFLSEEKLQEVAAATMVGGATLTKLLGTSAWYAPGAAGAFVVESIIHNQGKMVPCSVYLEGEYGESDICCGVPVILGKNGIEKIVELPLNEEEKAKFAASAAAVRKTNAALHEVGAL